MSVVHIDHYNLRAKRELLDELRDFYLTILRLEVGYRPPFRSFGYWLYAGERAILHLSEASPDEIRECHVKNTFDHIALFCTDLKNFEAHLHDKKINYRRAEVPQTGQIQLFLTDPAGNKVELSFTPNNS